MHVVSGFIRALFGYIVQNKTYNVGITKQEGAFA